jgi:hypothetical protein
VDQVTDGGYDLQEFILGWLAHLRKLLLIASGSPAADGELTPEEAGRYREQAGKLDDRDLLRMINILIDAEATMKRSTQSRLILEMACLRLCQLDSTVRLEEVIKMLEGEGGPEGPGADQGSGPPRQETLEVRQPAGPDEYRAGSAQTKADFESLWRDLVASVQQRNMTAGTCLALARPLGIEDGSIILSFGPNASFPKKTLESKSYQEVIQEEAVRLWGRKIKLICREEAGKAAEQPRNTAFSAPEANKAAGQDGQAPESPRVKKFLEAVDGELI